MSPLLFVLLGVAVLLLTPPGAWKAGKGRTEWARLPTYVLMGVLLLLLVRSGLPWLAAAGGVLAASWRWLGPLALRVLPILFVARASGAVPPKGDQAPQPPRSPPSGRMSREEALAVLGLSEDASSETIQQAYTELIRKVHPDRGGSAYLAARVNLARDELLRRQP